MRFLNESGSNLLDSVAFYAGTDLIEIRSFNYLDELYVGVKINGLFLKDHLDSDFYQFKILTRNDKKRIEIITPLFTLV